jgi:hypothetical protein
MDGKRRILTVIPACWFKCPGTAFPIRVYKNGVKGISESVLLLCSVLEVGVEGVSIFHTIYKFTSHKPLLINNNVALFIKQNKTKVLLSTVHAGFK